MQLYMHVYIPTTYTNFQVDESLATAPEFPLGSDLSTVGKLHLIFQVTFRGVTCFMIHPQTLKPVNNFRIYYRNRQIS